MRLILLLVAAVCLAGPAWAAPTFNRDIAPIIFANCVSCHHPGGSAPFPFTSFKEVKKHAQLIAKVTGSRYMPPWMPVPGHGDFKGERVLTPEQIAAIAEWVKTGAAEGAPGDLKVKAEWKTDWQLGKPDLIVTMPEPFSLPASGPDIYRNFVIPSVVLEEKYVVAYELRPTPPQAVHHAFILLDRKGGSRRLDQKDPAPGFPGMNVGADAGAPQGAFASWQPGAQPRKRAADSAWVLPKKSDLVLQLHMRPTGKRESVQVSVGFYFTEKPPHRVPMVLCLRSTAIDIPAGQSEYIIESAYTLPVDGDVLSVLPHQHYLGKHVHAWVDMPDGTQQHLLYIKKWDFNWQGAYDYAKPVSLPKGATLRMKYTYDNSKKNPRNPNQPPKRVRYGTESSDEMGEFWVQFLPHRESDLPVLQRDFIVNLALPDKIARCNVLLERNPKDAATRAELAASFLTTRKFDDAVREARQALADDPRISRAHYVIGSVHVARNEVPEARAQFEAMVGIDPDDSEAQNNLGFLLLAEGKAAEAVKHLEKAVELNPDDALAKRNLEKARAELGK